MIQTTTLENGLRLVTEDTADFQSVALSFWVGTGSRDEKEGERGMSHFLEHLLFKGSEQRSAFEIAEAIDGVGGDMNAFTTKECTAFYVRVLSEDCELALDILCDIMSAPALDPTETEAERQVVLEEILMRGDDPADLAHDYLSQAMFAGHSLGYEILGDADDVGAIASADLRRFFDHHYRPGNLVFAAAGDVRHDWLATQVERRFRDRTGGQRPGRVSPMLRTGETYVYKRPSDQAHLVIGVPGPNRHDPDRYAASLLDTILGGGMSSRLFQEVREKRGLAYTVYSSFAAYEDAGEFSVYIGTGPKRVHEAIDVVNQQLQAVKSDGVTEAELQRAKRHSRATIALGLEDSSARMSRIGRSLLLHGDVLSIDEINGRVEAVTRDDVSRVAQRLFAVDPTIVGVGPLRQDLSPVARKAS